MAKTKTLSYDWEYGHEELYLKVNSYLSGNNLYIGLESDEGSFADLTVNLPDQRLAPNETFVSGDFAESKIEFIKKHELGEILPETVPSGFCIYQKVAFDLEKLAMFDLEGIKEYCEIRGISTPGASIMEEK